MHPANKYSVAEKIKWIVSDITSFAPETRYDIWHDRATFHFLTTPEQIAKEMYNYITEQAHIRSLSYRPDQGYYTYTTLGLSTSHIA